MFVELGYMLENPVYLKLLQRRNKVPKYRVNVQYDMGMGSGGEVLEFERGNNRAARRYLKKLEGSDLSLIKRGVGVLWDTFSRVIEVREK